MQNDFLTPYKEDSGVPPYLPFPRFLVPMDLSNDAKVLYALLLDRAGISRENGYIEPDGRIRLYYTLEEAKDGVKEIMLDKKFGASGNTMVVEEFMTGREVSVLSFVDGKTISFKAPYRLSLIHI